MRKLILAILCAVMFSGCVGIKRYNKDVSSSYDLGVTIGKLEESIECCVEITKIQKRHEIDIRELMFPPIMDSFKMFPSMDGFSIDISTAQLELLNKNRPIE